MSEPLQGHLGNIQQAIANRLTSKQELTGIDIITERIQDIENVIDQALNVLKGICIIVITPNATVKKQNLPGPYFDDCQIFVRVVENVLINSGPTGTKKQASFVAERVANALHLFVIDGRALVCGGIKMVPDPLALIYDVTFKTNFGL